MSTSAHYSNTSERPSSHDDPLAASKQASQQQEAISALEAYQRATRAELAEQSLNESSEAVSSAVKKLVVQHESEVHSLASENTQLREQLTRASDIIDSLSSQLRQSVTATSTTLRTMAGSSASRAAGSAEDEVEEGGEADLQSLPSSASGPSALVDSFPHTQASTPVDDNSRAAEGRPGAEETDAERQGRALAALVETALPTAESLTSVPGALEAFVAHYADLRGRVQHLLTERRLWQHQLAQLTPLLRSMTAENADFRQTLTLLKATHVPAEALHEAVKARDEARTELRLLRLEAARLEHELADAAAQREQQELRLRTAAEPAAPQTPSVSPAPPASDLAAVPPYPHDSQWAVAIRELEEQAIVAANQHQLRRDLDNARAETARLQGENEVLRDALAAAQAEEACLREDAQNATFRNGVLSQQVTSLLVKVERLRREQVRSSTVTPQRQQDTAVKATSSAGARGVPVDGAWNAAVTRVPSRTRQHTIAWGGAREGDGDASRASARAAAVASQQLLDRRARQGGSSWLLFNGSASALETPAADAAAAAPLSDPAHRLSVATLRRTDGQLSGAVHTRRDDASAADQRTRDPFLSFSDVVLEESRCAPASSPRWTGSGASARASSTQASSSVHALPSRETLEFERGVSRNLRSLGRRTWTRSFGVEAGARDDTWPEQREGGAAEGDGSGEEGSRHQRRRVLTLRNLGSSVLEVELPCVPRLPASDRLSGVALGRPSAYSVLDARTGAVTRQLTSAEATLLSHGEPDAAQDRARTAGTADGTAAAESPLALVNESAEDVLAILDMLENEDLGGLERYSANTVSELVLRNQELLVQLYKVTQRAEKAEAHERALQHAVRGDDRPIHAKSLISHGDGAAPQEGLTLLRGPRRLHVGEEAGSEATSRSSPTTSVEAGAVASADEETAASHTQSHGAAAGTPSVPPGQKRSRAQAHGDGEGEEDTSAEAGVKASSTAGEVNDVQRPLSDSGVALVRQLMNDVLERNDAAVAWGDESVASALIDVLQTMRPLRPTVSAPSAAAAQSLVRGDAEAEESAQSLSFMDRADAAVSEAALHSVIQLCAAQAVQLARHELDTHEARVQAAEQGGWSAAQASLQAAMTDLKKTFVVPHEERLAAMHKVMQAMYEGGDAMRPVASADQESGLLRVLERLQKLLQAATRKDGSVLAALSASHERQRALLARRQRKSRRVAQDHPTTATAHGVFGDETTMEGPSHVNEKSVEPCGASPQLQPQLTPTTSMPSIVQPPPQVGSPVGGTSRDFALSRTPRRGPSAAPTAPHHHHRPIADYLLSGSDDEAEAHEAVYAELRDQLALEEAKQKKLADELQAEKSLHLSLHERMWKLECERDDAVASVQDAKARMETMLTREDFENVVGDLDDAKRQIDDLQAQLRFVHQEKNRLQLSSEALQHQLDHHEEARQQATADSRLALQQREQQLSQANELEYTLRQEVTALQNLLKRHEEDALRYAAQLQSVESEKAALADELVDLRRRFLADDRTQALLQVLYPGDTALEANAALIHALSREKEALAARLAAVELDVEERKTAQSQLQDTLRSAIQDRQEAELALQSERAARLAVIDDLGADEPGMTSQEGAAGVGEDADTARGVGPVATSLAQLRRQVQSLRVQLVSSQQEVERLREAECAWKLREQELRTQLDAMSRDPVSRAVRQHGLQACRTFEDVLAQMQIKLDELTEARDAAQSAAAAVQSELSAAQNAAETQKASCELVASQREEAQKALQQVQSQLDQVRETLAAREAALSTSKAQVAELETSVRTLERNVREVEAARDAVRMDLDRTETEKARFWEDNTKLMEKLKELQQDLTRLDTEKRAANAALAQGMNSASRLHGRHPRGGHSAPGRASLTGDLSMTPITPPNQRTL